MAGVSGKTGTVTYGSGPTTLCADNWDLDISPDDIDTSNFCAATTAQSGHTAGKDSVSGPKNYSVTVSGPMLQNTSTGALVTTFPTKGSKVNITLGNSGVTGTTITNRNYLITSITLNLSVAGRMEYSLSAVSCV
jgi:hypothetical protein